MQHLLIVPGSYSHGTSRLAAVGLLLSLASTWNSPTFAQDAPGANAGDHKTLLVPSEISGNSKEAAAPPASLEDATVYRWDAKPPMIQMAEDATPVPPTMGAVFVPSITNGIDEPKFIVRDTSGAEVGSGQTGQRLVLLPGSYVVEVGSGPVDQAVRVPVDVKLGETSLLPATWGAIRIEVVDDRLNPLRNAYEIIRMDTRELVGTGFGANTFQGEPLSTWLLAPGLYRIVQPGDTFRARTNYASVVVQDGGLVRFRLVVDEDNGDYRGAGVVLPNEFGSVQSPDEPFRIALTVGANGSINQTSNVVGLPNQTTIAADGFVQGQVRYDDTENVFSGIASLEEGISVLQPAVGDRLPAVKGLDRLQVNLLYVRFLVPWFGPYARMGLEANMFQSRVLAAEDTQFDVTRQDGTVVSVARSANTTFKIADGFGATQVSEGVGGNFRLFNDRYLRLNTQLGLGLRQNLYDGTLLEDDDPTTLGVQEYRELSSFNQVGVEAVVVGSARLTGWVGYATQLEYFGDFEDMSRPNIEWDNTLTFRLSEYLSFNYTASITRQPRLTSTTQLDHRALLRASVNLF